jgi:hypothetical protein
MAGPVLSTVFSTFQPDSTGGFPQASTYETCPAENRGPFNRPSGKPGAGFSGRSRASGHFPLLHRPYYYCYY